MGGVGDAFGWDGAMRLQEEQRARMAVMAGVMPGQKNDDSAREHIWDTPWWAECRASSTRSRRAGGITMRSLYRAMPSKLVSLSRNWWYGLRSGGVSPGMSGNPSSMISNSLVIEASLAIARRTSSQVTDLITSEGAESTCVQIFAMFPS